MYLIDLAKVELTDHSMTHSLATAPRFRVTSCPWLAGRIMRWSPGGVTVKFDVPNTPWNADNVPPEKDDPESNVGNYTGVMCVSAQTEVQVWT